MTDYRPPGLKYTSIRLAADLAARIARLVDCIADRTGLRPTTASVITQAIKAGLPEIERRNGLVTPSEDEGKE